MNRALIRFFRWTLLLASLPAVYANTDGPPIRNTGAPVDGGSTCRSCHNAGPPLNQGAGRIIIRANSYSPGVTQNLSVEVRDPNAIKWGFQLTARLASDETKAAGAFTANSNIRVRCAPDGRDAPCGTDVQFASHRADSIFGGQGGSKTFNIEWTPPARDLGPVIFYAAGTVAVNGSFVDDRVYSSSVRITTAGCVLPDVPRITTSPAPGIANAASFTTGISSNSLISIFGSGFARFGESATVSDKDLLDGKLPVEFACVAVEIGGKRAPLYYVQDTQINLQAPILTGTGPAPVRVIVNPGTTAEKSSAVVSVAANSASPGLFTFNGTSAAALTQSNRILADPSVVAGGVPAKPGEVITLYGTGFGLTDPVYQPGEFANGLARITIPFTVTIGGTTLSPADVLYAGLSPDAPGFYQFNVRVPASAPDGDVPVVIEIGGFRTKSTVTIPIRR